MKPQLFCSLKDYKPKNLLSDAFAGLMVVIIALPLSIGLGIDSGASPQVGLITAIVGGLLISMLGGSKFQIGGPSATFVVVVSGYLSDPEIGFLGMQIATIGAGILLVLMGLCRVGKLVKFIPYPIIIGFTSGIGLTLMLSQFKNFLGLSIADNPTDFIGKVTAYAQNISSFNWLTFVIGMATLAIIIGLPFINKKIPSSIIAIVIMSIVAFLISKFAMNEPPIATIGTAFGDLKPSFDFISFGAFKNIKVTKLIAPAFIIAFLCSIESLLSATVADGMTDTKHDSNQELVGQGIANIASPLFGGMPCTGVLARTAANIKYKAKSPLAGMFHAILMLVFYVALMPILKFVPLTCLSAILIVVAYNMSNFPLFARLSTFAIRDTIALVFCFVVTAVVDITYGVLGGIALTFILMIPNFIHPVVLREYDFVNVVGNEKFKEETKKVFLVDGDICFLFVNKIINRIMLESLSSDIVILDMSLSRRIDVTSVEKLAKCAKALSKQNRRLVIHNANDRIKTRYINAFCHIVKKW